MKTLVTGATGFIGTHLVRALVADGREVRCLTRTPDNKQKIAQLGAEVFVGDLLNIDSLTAALKCVNTIYHLAGEVYSWNVKDYVAVNVHGTQNLLECSLNNGIERFIHCSSIAAAGPNPDKNTLLTENLPCSPITPYGQSKLEAEKIVLHYYHTFKLPIVIIRPPTVYGPGQSDAITEFFRQVKKGRFYLIDDGQYLRSLCYISNLIDGFLLAEKKREAEGEIFYISDKEVYTFKEIALKIAEAENIKLIFVNLPSSIADTAMFTFSFLQKYFNLNILKLYTIGTLKKNLGCSILKAEENLSFKPNIDLRKGVETTYQYLKQNKAL
jgi:nucleoside-diphosphate-sugar epimerase